MHLEILAEIQSCCFAMCCDYGYPQSEKSRFSYSDRKNQVPRSRGLCSGLECNSKTPCWKQDILHALTTKLEKNVDTLVLLLNHIMSGVSVVALSVRLQLAMRALHVRALV